MKEKKFASGAFVFTRAKGVQPKEPEELRAMAKAAGFDPGIVPAYAGDRAAIGRAITQTERGLQRRGFLLRPLRRTASEVLYAVVRERKDSLTERVDHEQLDLVRWTAEPDPAVVQGSHIVAQEVAQAYAGLRGKVVAEDWSGSVSGFLEAHDAARVREDGRVYWVPPQRLADIRKLGELLGQVGIDLVLCELEPEVRTIVHEVVSDSLADQLEQLQAEAEAFDGKEKPSTFTRRLETYQRLRERATLYRDALGVGVENAQAVLASLEAKVQGLLDVRLQTVVHRAVNGFITRTRIDPVQTATTT